jgi:methionyl-tRNA synthetase
MWFHTVYWPAMLLALGLPLPRQVFAHGWWTSEGEKMSKTRGNFIDLAKLRGVIANYSLDALRYYLLRAAPFGNDLDWKGADFSAAFNELANVLGNCLNRIVNMTNRYRGGALPPVGERESADDNVVERTARLADEVADAYRNVALQQCALVPIELARAVNGYIDATAPFKLAKDPARSARLDTVLHLSAQAVYRALVALLPIMPEKAAEGLAQLGVDTTSGRTLGQLLGEPLPVGHRFAEGKPLFPKVEAAR